MRLCSLNGQKLDMAVFILDASSSKYESAFVVVDCGAGCDGILSDNCVKMFVMSVNGEEQSVNVSVLAFVWLSFIVSVRFSIAVSMSDRFLLISSSLCPCLCSRATLRTVSVT